MANGKPAREVPASVGEAEKTAPGSPSGEIDPAVIEELERRLEVAKQEWELRARQHSRVEYRRWRMRRARQTAAEVTRALSEYKAVWRALQQAYQEAGAGPE